ncbi:MAG TPA: hypothetical protein VEX68_30295 [Bryobacteraceae bacterium]|nr:hypothetical protein [Bryobacteraceae bacterium]
MIFVSTGQRTRVFRSIEDVPAALRQKLNENISGPNCRTLIVADRRGREYLFRALKRATTERSVSTSQHTHMNRSSNRWTGLRDYWLEIGLVALLGVASWALFNWK